MNIDAMWQTNLGSDETMGGDGLYPERPGEPDCSYYIRTGLCRFGSTCRFNHPYDRKLVLTLYLCVYAQVSEFGDTFLLSYLAFPLFLVGSFKFVAVRVCCVVY